MFALILALLPAVPHIIIGVEHLFGHGNGASKKQAATSALADIINAFAQSTGTQGSNSSTMALIDDLIEATVKYFNSNGTFTHSEKL